MAFCYFLKFNPSAFQKAKNYPVTEVKEMKPTSFPESSVSFTF